MKHKHAEVIKAFIEGIECEWSAHSKGWWKIDNLAVFNWADDVRIKPKPKPDVVKYCYVNEFGTCNINAIEEYEHNLKVTFDGETGKLKSAEVIKNAEEIK
jgi:hypothetical protein